ncbi:MAG: ParA family protein [Gammaproteobacteria bacterium]|nr:ParA family protein [Gammaproteobacteria bacterium]
MPKKVKKTPIVVSIINLKGGVGKTTIAALLARDAASKGLKVLAVDIDPQSNLSQSLLTENEYKEFMEQDGLSIVELLNGYKPPSQQHLAPTKIDENQCATTSWF